jgi:hypothetical protein
MWVLVASNGVPSGRRVNLIQMHDERIEYRVSCQHHGEVRAQHRWPDVAGNRAARVHATSPPATSDGKLDAPAAPQLAAPAHQRSAKEICAQPGVVV